MTKEIVVKRIRGGSLVKTIVVGSGVGCAILATVFGVFALFGAEVVEVNDQPLTGIAGFLAAPLVGLFVGGVLGLFTALFAYIGLRIFSLFGDLAVEYVPSERVSEAAPMVPTAAGASQE